MPKLVFAFVTFVLSMHAYAQFETELSILVTGDVQGQLTTYDYLEDQPQDRRSLTQIATLIRHQRAKHDNSILVDVGDTVYGSPMMSWASEASFQGTEQHPSFKAMRQLNYDVLNVGSHDLNFGLDYYLSHSRKSNIPTISANLRYEGFNGHDGTTVTEPWRIIQKTVLDIAGQQQQLNIGVIGLLSPRTLAWNQHRINDRLEIDDIIATARQEIPKMTAAGADIIIALVHTGSSEPISTTRNIINQLTRVDGIDALAVGDQAYTFPRPLPNDALTLNPGKGTINGVPVVMPGRFGSHLGVINFRLIKRDGEWRIRDGSAYADPVMLSDRAVVPTIRIEQALRREHRGTRNYVNRPVGYTNQDIDSYLGLIQPSTAAQLINRVQTQFARHWLEQQNLDLPIISAASFIRFGSDTQPDNWVSIEHGLMTHRDIASLAPHESELILARVSGYQLKEWLECSASAYNQLDTQAYTPQSLINEDFDLALFDTFDGTKYRYDLHLPPRYASDCETLLSDSERVFMPDDFDFDNEYLVVSTALRWQRGLAQLGISDEQVIYRSALSNRELITQHLAGLEDGISLRSSQRDWFKAVPAFHQLEVAISSTSNSKAIREIEIDSSLPLLATIETEQNERTFVVDFPRYTPLPPDQPLPEVVVSIPEPELPNLEISVEITPNSHDSVISRDPNSTRAHRPSVDTPENEIEDYSGQ